MSSLVPYIVSIIAYFNAFVKYFMHTFNLSPIVSKLSTEILMLSTSYPQARSIYIAFFFGTFLYLRGFRYILVAFYPSPGSTF
jgi:hypothetical protein